MEVEVGGFLNDSSNYDYTDDYEYKEDVKLKNGDVGQVLIPTVYSVVLALGLAGNVLLLIVLAQKRRCWRISDIVILNHGVADILLLLTLPFWAAQAAQQSGWCFGTPLCKICGAVFNINFYCGIFLLVCISLDHFLSITRSVQLYSHKKPILLWATPLLVWFISLILTIPDWIYLVNEKDTTQVKTLCVHKYSNSGTDWQLWARLLHHIVGLLLPAATLIICWSCILLRLQCSPKDLQKQRAVTILLLVVVFFICWMPYSITLVVDTYENSSKKPQDSLSEGSSNSLMVTFVLACVHACVRPLLYLLLCANFRKQVVATLRCEVGVQSKDEFEKSLWEMVAGEEPLPHQSHETNELNQVSIKCDQHNDDDEIKTPYRDSEDT